MKWYTKDHVWLEPDERTGKLVVGITHEGNEAMDGITYIEAVDGKLVVESVKTSLEITLPVKGKMQEISMAGPVTWPRDYAVTVFEPGYELDTSQCMDEEAYMEYARQ